MRGEREGGTRPLRHAGLDCRNKDWNILEFAGVGALAGAGLFLFWRKTWCPPCEGGGAGLVRTGGATWSGAPAKRRGEPGEMCPLG